MSSKLDIILLIGHKSRRHLVGPSYLKPLSGQYIVWPFPLSWTRQKSTVVISAGINRQRMSPEVCNHYGEGYVRRAYWFYSNEIIDDLVRETRNSRALEMELHIFVLTRRYQLNNGLPDVEVIPMSKSKESMTMRVWDSFMLTNILQIPNKGFIISSMMERLPKWVLSVPRSPRLMLFSSRCVVQSISKRASL